MNVTTSLGFWKIKQRSKGRTSLNWSIQNSHELYFEYGKSDRKWEKPILPAAL